MSFLLKSDLGFWIYGLMSALGPSGPSLGPFGFILKFLRKYGPVCEKWSYFSWLMAG